MGANTDAVAVDPLPEPRPGMEQRLMGDLHVLGPGGDEALLDEGVENGLGAGVELQQSAPGHAPSRASRSVGHVHEAGEYPTGQFLLVGGELGIDFFGACGDRSADAAAVAVVRDRQPPAVAALPGGQQRVRQQWQGAGVMVPQQYLDQAVFDVEPCRACPAKRPRCAALLLSSALRAPDETGARIPAPDNEGHAGRNRPGTHDGRAAARAHGRPRAQCPDEGDALALIVAGGEDLLELVHDDDHALVRSVVRSRSPPPGEFARQAGRPASSG